MNQDRLKRTICSINALEQLKKLRILNPVTVRKLLIDPEQMAIQLETATAISKMFGSPFERPDDSVDGLIRFASTENKLQVGLNPEECHCLICGQTGSGKSTLLKILLSQALQKGEYDAD